MIANPENVVIYFHIWGYRVPGLNEGSDRLNLNGNNWNEFNDNRYSFGIALAQDTRDKMPKTYDNLYNKVISLGNLTLAWRKARKGKTQKDYVIEFEKNIQKNLLELHNELKDRTYQPRPLKTFPLQDPKTRLISKSDFRDRVVHHAINLVLEPIFEPSFIADSCVNRKGKGTLYAIKRFHYFKRKVTKNGQIKGYCLKADVKHYFQNIDHEILLNIIKRKLKDEKLIWLIARIVANSNIQRERVNNFAASGERHASRKFNISILRKSLS